MAPEHIDAIALARHQARSIIRATRVAMCSGWSCAVFAFFTLLGGLFSMPAFLLGLGLGVVAVEELRGAALMRKFNLSAPRRLGFNQIALGVMLFAYAGWSILAMLTGPGMYDAYLHDPLLAQTLEPIARLHTAVTIGFYSLVIFISIFAQGGMAMYYFTRRKHMADYLNRTPKWIVDALRAAAM